MNKNQILNAIAWGFIIMGVGLLVWKIFGNSPAEDGVLTALAIGLLFKVMAIGNDLTELKMSHKYLAKDFKEHVKHR